jgi:hypothetical protein
MSQCTPEQQLFGFTKNAIPFPVENKNKRNNSEIFRYESNKSKQNLYAENHKTLIKEVKKI